MVLKYAAAFSNQEEPQVMPNEVAYRLSELLGHDHFLIHRALLTVNPELLATDTDLYLPVEQLAPVAAEIDNLLLGGALA